MFNWRSGNPVLYTAPSQGAKKEEEEKPFNFIIERQRLQLVASSSSSSSSSVVSDWGVPFFLFLPPPPASRSYLSLSSAFPTSLHLLLLPLLQLGPWVQLVPFLSSWKKSSLSLFSWTCPLTVGTRYQVHSFWPLWSDVEEKLTDLATTASYMHGFMPFLHRMLQKKNWHTLLVRVPVQVTRVV